MKKLRLGLMTLTILVVAVFMVSCSGTVSIKDLENAINKNKEIKYSKTNVEISATMMGMKIGANISGEVDNRNNKSLMKMKLDIPMSQEKVPDIDMYVDDKTIYIKDPVSDSFLKSTAKDTGNMNFEKGLVSIAGDVLKKDEKVKETLKFQKGDNSDISISSEISPGTVKEIINNLITSEGFLDSVQSGAKAQFDGMAGELDKEAQAEASKQAETASKEAVEEIKKAIAELDISNIKYNCKINKEGYLYSEEISFNIKDKTSGYSLDMTLKTNSSDINADKTVTLPEIPKDKIIEQ